MITIHINLKIDLHLKPLVIQKDFINSSSHHDEFRSFQNRHFVDQNHPQNMFIILSLVVMELVQLMVEWLVEQNFSEQIPMVI